MKPNKLFFAATLLGLSAAAAAAEIEGRWQTIDDETKKPKAVVEIRCSDNVCNGTIVALSEGVQNVCPACADKRPLIGLRVLSGLQKHDGKYEGGRIFDPKKNKTYKSTATVSADGKSLNVRGYIGVSALGRTQTWKRVQ